MIVHQATTASAGWTEEKTPPTRLPATLWMHTYRGCSSKMMGSLSMQLIALETDKAEQCAGCA